MVKSRQGKIFHLAIFLLGLYGLAYSLTGKFEIPHGDAAIWLHAGLLLIVFGTYWIEYHFTKPDDVVINGLLVFVSVSVLHDPPLKEWWDALRYASLALTVLAFLIGWSGSPAVPNTRHSAIKKLAYLVVVRLGNSNVIFSAVFLLSIVSYFDLKSGDTKWMMVFWAIVVTAKHLELDQFFQAIWTLWRPKAPKAIGEVSKFCEPGLVRFQLFDGAACRRNTPVYLSHSGTFDNASPIAVVTSLRHSPECVEAEAMVIDSEVADGTLDNRRLAFPLDDLRMKDEERVGKNPIIKRLEQFIGVARHGSNVSRLFFEVTASRAGLAEGHLVSVGSSDGANVYFQLVNGTLHEEANIEGGERAFTVGSAEQVGTWSDEKRGFETFSWVVAENSAVLHVAPSEGAPARDSEKTIEVGRVPNSSFPVNINVADLVLYHSAILGVTGSGKTFLAYQLIERAAADGVKVLCLDGTGDYKRYVRGAVLLKNLSATRAFLDQRDKRIGIIEFAEEGKNPIASTNLIAATALKWCQANRTDQEIKEPVPKVLIVVEEAHTLVPEFNFNPERTLQNEVSKTAQTVLQARKFGLGFMIVTQRTANVTKSILNQCNTIFAFQAHDETGFDFLKNYMGEHYVQALPNLKLRQGVIVGKASVSERPIIAEFHRQDRDVAEEEPPGFPAPEADPPRPTEHLPPA